MGWTFTADEFAHVWRETGHDRVPFPLRLLETPRTEDEARRLRSTLDQRFVQGSDPDLTACLRIVAEPHARIVLVGGGHTPGSEIRLLACAVYDHAVLVVQEPGTRPDYGGQVRVSIGHSAGIGARVTACLPDTPPGREPAREAAAEAVRDEETVIAAHPSVPRIQRLLRRQHTAEGHIRIETGLDRETPSPPVHYSWIDVAGDGRYLLRVGETVHVVPASTGQLAAQLQRRVAPAHSSHNRRSG
ncbi:ESX secretion-associated protein EspG [Nocardia caishijiensis]|uniref:ESAT-6 protein secretion system EspG family protein n=1 Tax=Nocardia caishijiensis TaxID=184756 RepID=A0ABQ6YK92_9NOCA|nr:ESX secretion-associated protein EspG [Nocardia caishijiensis]KAF0845866.1 ESAT-6 protein secretion system EspG family protein [Nocardia caishijiensis]